MKSVLKKVICVLCMAVMIVSMTACNVSVSAVNNLKKSAAEYNADYLAENFQINHDTCVFIADKLDEYGFGKIKTNKMKLEDGNGSITISDLKNKYVINVEDGVISNITTKEGIVVLTIDDIVDHAAESFENTDPALSDNSLLDPDSLQEEPLTPAEPQEEPSTTDNSTSTAVSTGSYLTAEQEKILNSLETDYNKVNWGVQYSPTGMEGIVISVAPYLDGNYTYLLVAVTNLYDQDVTFSGKGFAKGLDGQAIGTVSFYDTAIRPGHTIARTIYCEDLPTGEIHWDSIELPTVFDESVYWESDWALATDSDGYPYVAYQIQASENMIAGSVVAVLLDASGNVLGVATDYNADKGTTATGEAPFYTKNFAGTPVDIAMFANPLKAN